MLKRTTRLIFLFLASLFLFIMIPFSSLAGWEPTTSEEIELFSKKTAEPLLFYSQWDTSNLNGITITSVVQGENFMTSIRNALNDYGTDYDIGYTYNLYVNGEKADSFNTPLTITIQIPESLEQDGRTYVIAGTDETGAGFILADSDYTDSTITFTTDSLYAFAICYKD